MVYLIDGVRTPYVKAGADFDKVNAKDLGRTAMAALLNRANVDMGDISEIIIGNVGGPANAPNIARVIALESHVPQNIPAFTVHRNCASGMEAIADATLKINAKEASLVIAGGVESMSQMPLMFNDRMRDFFGMLMKAKTPAQKLSTLTSFRMSNLAPVIAVVEGLKDPVCGLNMGQTADLLAREWKITRDDQDKFALKSHLKAKAGYESGFFKDEITPMFLAPKFKKVIDSDIGPRFDQTLESLNKLKPYFVKPHGTVTVGNACQVTDGAAMVVLGNEETAKKYKPMARIVAYQWSGLEPERMGLGPAYAIAQILKKTGMSLNDIDLFEINEAFAAQVIACQRALKDAKFCKDKLGFTSPVGEIPDEKLNIHGGAIALGHPVGSTGTRIVHTLARSLKMKNKRYGIASLCIGGGQGGAVLLEAV